MTTARVPPPVRASRCPDRAAPPTTPLPRRGRRSGVRRLPRRGGTPVLRGAARRASGGAATIGACERRRSWDVLFGRLQQQAHGTGERIPFRLLRHQLPAPFRRNPVVTGALPLVGQLS